MCLILKQNAGRGMIQDRANIIPQHINILLWIRMKKSLNRNVLMERIRNLMVRIPLFHLTFTLYLNRSLAFFNSPSLFFSDFTSEELPNF
jgi:hypothetical protein